MLRCPLLLHMCLLLGATGARGTDAAASQMESCTDNSTLSFCSVNNHALCDFIPHSQKEHHAALADGVDELRSLSNQPSNALLLALRLPQEGQRNYMLPRAYLPSPRYWCELRAKERELLMAQEEYREELHSLYCQAHSTDLAEASQLLAHRMVKGGVAKMLIYMSESAVRLALEGKLQSARNATFLFALGVESCPKGLFSCFFRPSLCDVYHLRPRSRRPHRKSLGYTPSILDASFQTELSWPSALKRSLLVSISLHQRIYRLQSRLEAKVTKLLSRCITMDKQGRISSNGERHIASPPGGLQAMAMHVRRGDSCETFDFSTKQGVTDLDAERRCYPVRLYIKAAEAMRSLYGIERVLLITDSPKVIGLIRKTAGARHFEWQWLDLDRGVIGGDATRNLHQPPEKRVYIEHRAESRDPANALQVESVLADLRFTSEASVVIGTSRSFVSHAIQMVIWARSGVLPPTISFEGDPIYTLLHVRGKFWTRSAKKRADDRGWIPCPYSRPHTPAICFSCQNLSIGEGGMCLDDSFAAKALELVPGNCVDMWRRECNTLQHPVIT